jgi:hypothetical protein
MDEDGSAANDGGDDRVDAGRDEAPESCRWQPCRAHVHAFREQVAEGLADRSKAEEAADRAIMVRGCRVDGWLDGDFMNGEKVSQGRRYRKAFVSSGRKRHGPTDFAPSYARMTIDKPIMQ